MAVKKDQDIFIKRYRIIKMTFDSMEESAFKSVLLRRGHSDARKIYELIYRMGGKNLTTKIRQLYFSQSAEQITPDIAKKKLNQFHLALKKSFRLLYKENTSSEEKESILEPSKRRYNRIMELLDSSERICHADPYSREGYMFKDISPQKIKAKKRRRFAKKWVVNPLGHFTTGLLGVGQACMSIGTVILIFSNPAAQISLSIVIGLTAVLCTLVMTNRNTRQTLMQLFYDFDFTAGLSSQFRNPWHKSLISLMMLGFIVLSIAIGLSIGIAMFSSALLLPVGFPFITATAAIAIGAVIGVTAIMSYSCTLYVRFVDLVKRIVQFVKEFREGPSLKKRWKDFQNEPLEVRMEVYIRYGVMALLLPIVIGVSIAVIVASLNVLNGMVFDFFHTTLSLSTAISTQLANILVYGLNFLSTSVFIFESLYDSIVGGGEILASGIMGVVNYVRERSQTKVKENKKAQSLKQKAQACMKYAKENPLLAIKSAVLLAGFTVLAGLACVNAIGTGIYAMVGAPAMVKLFSSVGIRIGKVISSILVFLPAAFVSIGAVAEEGVPLYQRRLPFMIPGCLTGAYESMTEEDPTSEEVWERIEAKQHDGEQFPKISTPKGLR